METQKWTFPHFPVTTLPLVHQQSPNQLDTFLSPFFPPAHTIYITPPQSTHIKTYHAAHHVPSLPRDHELNLWQWWLLGQVLHEHCSFHHKSHKDTAITTQSIKAQDRRDKRPSCPPTFPTSKPRSFCLIPYPTWRHLEDVEKGRSILLDCWGDRPLFWYHKLEQTLANGAALHIPRPCFFRGIWWHRQWISQQQLCHGGHAAWSPMLLRLSDRRQKHL